MRKQKPKIRITLPDPKFNDTLVTKFVNNMMRGGKKNTSYNIFYKAMDIVQDKLTEENPVDVFKKALTNITPAVEVKSRRIGGATFQVPTQIYASRKESIGLKALIAASRKRHEKTMGERLAGEILAAYKEEGAAFKKKEEIHRMAEANKAFAHFRF